MNCNQIPADSAWQPDPPAPALNRTVVPDYQMQAVDAALSWLERWGQHVVRCPCSPRYQVTQAEVASKTPRICSCGLAAIRNDLDIAFHPENWVLGDGA